LACAGGTQRLSWLVGEGWAKRIILCGERVDARTAERIGLVEEVVAKGEAKDKALALAAQVGNQSPIAVAYSKELIHQARNVAMEKALPYERQRFVDLFGTEDQLEGVNAFLEKRKPQWKNK
jgi:enoyl-CoA hydratase/carnithine racemase